MFGRHDTSVYTMKPLVWTIQISTWIVFILYFLFRPSWNN
jgi:hypothetical protein